MAHRENRPSDIVKSLSSLMIRYSGAMVVHIHMGFGGTFQNRACSLFNRLTP